MRISLIVASAGALILAGAATASPAPDAMPTSAEGKAPAAPAVAQSPGAAAATDPAPAQPSQAGLIAEKVKADWDKYDEGAKGFLTRGEFGKWMGALRTAANQPAPDAKWLKTAFSQADTDSNAKIGASELASFLASGG